MKSITHDIRKNYKFKNEVKKPKRYFGKIVFLGILVFLLFSGYKHLSFQNGYVLNIKYAQKSTNKNTAKLYATNAIEYLESQGMISGNTNTLISGGAKYNIDDW